MVVFLVSLVSLFLYTHRDKKNIIDKTKTVYIVDDSTGFKLFRNGEPFEIKGVTGSGEHLKALSDIGGNTLRIYDTINIQSILDRAHENNIAVIIDLPIPKYTKGDAFFSHEENNLAIKKTVKGIVNKYKNHPALLFWNLGNELNYPLVVLENNFMKTFNGLIDLVHQLDSNHPVGTTVMTGKEALSIHLHSSNIDLIGYNAFGTLKGLKEKIKQISYFSKPLPYYISEYGNNGPWEEEFTSWNAPIEQTSTKKGEQFIERYNLYITTNQESMGDLLFFWGQKQEGTHTWFSLFDEEGSKSEAYYSVKSMWAGKSDTTNNSLKIKYMLIDQQGARDKLIYNANTIKTARLYMEKDADSIDLTRHYKWEIYEECWYYNPYENQYRPKLISKSAEDEGSLSFTFKTPSVDGPYRIFVQVYDDKGNFSTANTPFYVLNANE